MAGFGAESLKPQASAHLWLVSLPGRVVLWSWCYRIAAVPFILETVDCIAEIAIRNH